MSKGIPILILFAILSTARSGQAQMTTVWSNDYQHCLALNFSNEGRKVVVDGSGNVFVLADATSELDPNGIVTGSTYYYTVLLKYDASGALQNQVIINVRDHVLNGFSSKSGFGMGLDAAGNIYVGYNLYEISNDFDVHVSKYSNSLSFQWNYRYKPQSRDVGTTMHVTNSGDVYAIIESTTGGIDVTTRLLHVNGPAVTSSSLFSFDTNLEYLSALTVDGSGIIYVTGYRLVNNAKTILTSAIAPNGVQIWKLVYNGGSAIRDDFGTDIQLGYNDELYITGTSDRGVPSFNDAFIMKQKQATGKVFWVSYLDDNFNNDNGIFVRTLDSGFVYVFATTDQMAFTERVNINTGNSSLRGIVQASPSTPFNSIDNFRINDVEISSQFKMLYITGTILATNTSGQPFNSAYLIKQRVETAARGSVTIKVVDEAPVAGDYSQSLESADIALDFLNEKVNWVRNTAVNHSNHQKEEVNISQWDVNQPFRISNSESDGHLIQNFKLTISPNPSNGTINFSSTDNITTIHILDITGRTVFHTKHNASNGTLDLSFLENGTYHFHASGHNNEYNQTFLITGK